MPKFTVSSPSTVDALDSDRKRDDDLFTVDGESYGMLLEFSARESLHYATLVRQSGFTVAAAWAVQVGLGPDGYTALVGNPNTTDEQIEYVIKLAVARVLGRPDPKSPNFEEPVSEKLNESTTMGSPLEEEAPSKNPTTTGG